MSLIHFAKVSRKPQTTQRTLGDILHEIAQQAPEQIDHIRGIAEWILEQIRETPKAS